MKKNLVYDFPTRVFHWLFSGLFLSAFVIAKTIEDESALFSFHMLMGLTVGFLVSLRLAWGFVGTKHAKFSDFVLKPTELLQYFLSILLGEKKKWPGHNPASSWAALAMMVLAIGSALTGYLMASGRAKENVEGLHELCANAFIVVALFHVAGIIVHSWRYRELIGLSMIDGRKEGVSDEEAITSSYRIVGMLLLGLVLAFALNLWRNYDAQQRTLNLFGVNLILGEGK